MSGGLDLALAIFDLRADGGLERHALRLGEALVLRHHRVTVYTTGAGNLPAGLGLQLLHRRGYTNHGRMRAFARDVSRAASGRHDLLVGFQKMPGLDVLFCADWCYLDRKQNVVERMLPRARAMAALEAGAFGPSARTRLLLLAEPQAQAYRRAYPESHGRIFVLPPTLAPARPDQVWPTADRTASRHHLGLRPEEVVWLWIGRHPHVKGLDRAIGALAAAPGVRLIACGARTDRRPMRDALSLAGTLGCADRLVLTGPVSDETLARLFAAADLLVHPARLDVTGTVILEALAAGLPVIVTENCGYAPYVRAAGAGVVVSTEATPRELVNAASVSTDELRSWAELATFYTKRTDLTTGIPIAVSLLEQVARSPVPSRR